MTEKTYKLLKEICGRGKGYIFDITLRGINMTIKVKKGKGGK